MNNENDILEKGEKLKDFSPVTIFILLTFVLEIFALNKATNLLISVLVSLFTFGILSAMLREKYGELPQFKPLQKKIGLLSVSFVLIAVNNAFNMSGDKFNSRIRIGVTVKLC